MLVMEICIFVVSVLGLNVPGGLPPTLQLHRGFEPISWCSLSVRFTARLCCSLITSRNPGTVWGLEGVGGGDLDMGRVWGLLSTGSASRSDLLVGSIILRWW